MSIPACGGVIEKRTPEVWAPEQKQQRLEEILDLGTSIFDHLRRPSTRANKFITKFGLATTNRSDVDRKGLFRSDVRIQFNAGGVLDLREYSFTDQPTGQHIRSAVFTGRPDESASVPENNPRTTVSIAQFNREHGAYQLDSSLSYDLATGRSFEGRVRHDYSRSQSCGARRLVGAEPAMASSVEVVLIAVADALGLENPKIMTSLSPQPTEEA